MDQFNYLGSFTTEDGWRKTIKKRLTQEEILRRRNIVTRRNIKIKKDIENI